MFSLVTNKKNWYKKYKILSQTTIKMYYILVLAPFSVSKHVINQVSLLWMIQRTRDLLPSTVHVWGRPSQNERDVWVTVKGGEAEIAGVKWKWRLLAQAGRPSVASPHDFRFTPLYGTLFGEGLLKWKVNFPWQGQIVQGWQPNLVIVTLGVYSLACKWTFLRCDWCISFHFVSFAMLTGCSKCLQTS